MCVKMDKGKILVFTIIFCHITFACNCLKVIPERASITYVNEKYLSNVSVSVRRVSRGGNYVASLDFVTKTSIGNDAMIDIIFYEFLNNAFKRSFVELHFDACYLILRDPYVGSLIRNAGLSTCPIPPETRISFKNVDLSVHIPSTWPFEKGKAEVIATSNSTGDLIGKGEIVLTFKSN